ncbi:MAG: energy transducer TonB [Bryobacteraceae bacterium]
MRVRSRETRRASGVRQSGFLVPAALDAVKQWEYRPTLLNGRPVEVATE